MLQPQPENKGSKGLIAGLAVALAVIVAGIVAAVLIASGGSSDTPTVAAVTQAQSTARTTTVRIIERAAKRASSSKSSSPPSSSVAKAPATPTRSPLTAPSSALGDKAEIRSVVQRHWSAIESGNYSAAFGLLVSGSQSESSWISAHQQDRLINASISLGSPTLTSQTTATVPVNNLHTEAASGCFDWTGSYQMQKVGGHWRIGKANISRSAC